MAGAGAATETAAGRGAASAGRQQAGAVLSEEEGEDAGAFPPGQQAWLGAAASAHSGAAQEKDRAAASIKPNAFRVITTAYHATLFPARRYGPSSGAGSRRGAPLTPRRKEDTAS